MILYPTETIYALGVNALDEGELEKLFVLKGREAGKSVSWLVRDVADIARWGELTPVAARIAEQFLPGSLTLVLAAKDTVPEYRRKTGEVSFRISPDPIAQQLIAEFMAEHDAPLTCTSANVSGEPTCATPDSILEQFGNSASVITRVVSDGPRSGQASTVIRIINEHVEVLRKGVVPINDIIGNL